jgi:hypothetical protein
MRRGGFGWCSFGLAWTSLAVLLAAGCLAASDEIVAHIAVDAASQTAPDAGAVPDTNACCKVSGGEPFAATGAGVAGACPAPNYSLVIVTTEGAIYRVQPATGKVEKRGIAPCLTNGVLSAAVDVTGNLWAAASDARVYVIELETLTCKQYQLQLKPSAMAFVYDARFKQQLYVLEAGTLIVINPDSLTRAPIGPLAARALTATADGTLYAFSEQAVGTLLVSRVEPGNASLSVLSKVAEPTDMPFMGAAAAPGHDEFALIFQRGLYLLRTPNGALEAIAELLTDEPVVAVSSSPCAWWTK